MTEPAGVDPADELADVYRDLHRHPELAFREVRTAGIVADRLWSAGLDPTTGVGGTGVVGVLRHGDGPTVMLRADMDALPVGRGHRLCRVNRRHRRQHRHRVAEPARRPEKVGA